MIENPSESRQTNRLVRLEASINWPTGIGTELIDYKKNRYSDQNRILWHIGIIMEREFNSLNYSIFQWSSPNEPAPARSQEDTGILEQLIHGFNEIPDIITRAIMIEELENNLLDDPDIEEYLEGDSILKLVAKDSTGVKLLEWDRRELGKGGFGRSYMRGFDKGFDRYMQILEYLQK